jgi:protein-disulfide isomerase
VKHVLHGADCFLFILYGEHMKRLKDVKTKDNSTFTVIMVMLTIVVGVVGFAVIQSKKSADDATPVETDKLVGENPWIYGTTDAAITIVEFADYTCPACRASYSVWPQIVDKYPDQVRFVYRHFPVHGELSLVAMQAAEAAGAQDPDMFWQMDELLWSRDWESGVTSVDDAISTFTAYAEELGLNVDQFRSDLEAGTFQAKIDEDQQAMEALGVQLATPTVFINGTQYKGARTLDDVSKKIDTLLQGTN